MAVSLSPTSVIDVHDVLPFTMNQDWLHHITTHSLTQSVNAGIFESVTFNPSPSETSPTKSTLDDVHLLN